MGRAFLAGALVAALLLLSGLAPVGGSTQPGGKSIFEVRAFDGNLTGSTVRLEPGTTDDSVSITLPSNAQVINASLELSALPYTPGGTDYPLDPTLDIGADGTVDWAFSGFAHGPMGHQTSFHDGRETAAGYNLTMGSGERVLLPTRLPANATIGAASVTLGGWPTPFWRDPVKVTRNGQSPGENSPSFLADGDRLWVAWASKDPALVGGSDWDIVVSWSDDGTAWSAPVDISPPGDLYEDDSPDIIAYGGKVYVAWSGAQNESQFSNSNIFIRSWDGSRWEDLVRLTPNDLTRMNDWPQMDVFQGRLFVFWRTTDERLAQIIPYTGDMDMVYRTFDGDSWSSTNELTPDWDSQIDWSLNLVQFDGKLFAFWDMDTDLTDGFTVDIFYRYLDGSGWSAPYNIIPQPDAELDEIPKTAVYRNPVTGKDELWACWIRGSPGLHDLDIMVRRYDGISWGAVTELTTPGEQKDNMGAELLEYDGRLYAVWVTGTNTTEEKNSTIVIYNTFGDVVIRAYDGYGWSDLMELTPGEENDNANSPAMAVFKGKLYCGWAYPYEPASPGGIETWDIVVRNIDFRPVELELDAGDRPPADWGPSELGSTNVVVPLYADALEGALAALPRTRDRFGNEMCDLPVAIRSIYPSEVQVRNLTVSYTLTVRLDNISGTLNELMAQADSSGRAPPDVTIPLRLWANSTGAMRLDRLNLTYIINLPPVLIEAIPDARFAEDTSAPRLIDLERYFWDDWDDGHLRFELVFESNPSRIRALPEGRHLGFEAVARYWHGNGTFRVRAYDGGGLWAASNTFRITVDHVNHPPVLEPVPDQMVHVGERLYFTVRASDPDNDTLYFLSGDPRFPVVPLDARGNTAYVEYQAGRPERLLLNITVEDGFGGSDSRQVNIRIKDKTSTSSVEPCATWVVIVVLAAAGALAVEWFRRKYLRETGPVMGPGGEFTEEEVFEGVVMARLGGARLRGGSEGGRPDRFSPPESRPLTRAERAALERRRAEERIALPGEAVEADRAEKAAGEELRRRASRPGQALLVEVEAGKAATGAGTTGERAGTGQTGEAKDPLEELLRGS
ncbi:MAG: hypothetical protein FJ149_02255 [Euryarchaeota archaeon]|nr:hypothetical protein [Euryarchaeota archaeon]